MLKLVELVNVPDDGAVGFDAPEGEIVVARRDGAVFAYRNYCPHLGIGLNFQPDEFMDLDRQYLMCANHGALFRVEDGHCVWGPCVGQSLEKVAIQIKDGAIWLEKPA